MTLDEIKHKKKIAEDQMSNILIQFEKETGLPISSLSLEQVSCMGKEFPKRIKLIAEIK